MTAKSIADQISAIREATQKAAASPETALDFLRRAGIVVKQGEQSLHTTTIKSTSRKSK